MKIIAQLTYIFEKKQKIQMVLLIFCMMIGAMLELLGVSLITPLITAISDISLITENKIGKVVCNIFQLTSEREILMFFSLALVVVYLIKNVYLALLYYIQYKFVYDGEKRISVKLLKSYIDRDYTYHTKRNSSEIVRSVTTDTDQMFTLINNALTVLSEMLVTIVLTLYLFLTDALITTIVIVLIGICYFINSKMINSKVKEYGAELQKAKGIRIRYVNESMGAMKEIKVLNRGDFFIESFEKPTAIYAECRRKFVTLTQFPRLMLETVSIGGIMVLIAVKAYIGDDLSNIVPQLSAFALAAFRLLPSANRINTSIYWVNYFRPSINVIYKDLKEMEVKKPYQESRDKDEILSVNKSIEIEGISYRYPDAEGEILNNVSFSIPIGKSVAFVGQSGAGKTTMCDLILGVLKPKVGDIKVDGMSIYNNLPGWLHNVGYIPQNIYLTDDTIKKNVAFGISEENIDEKRVWECLEEAQIAEFVRELPDKLNTGVGEVGERISGGQKQRIGIARALYSNPKVLFLDEATSALDNQTEASVMQTINGLKDHMTLIIIAHRLTTIKECNIVYRVGNGAVVCEKDN